MKNFRFRSGIGLVFILLFIFNIGLVVIAVITTNHLLIGLGIVISCVQYYLHDLFRRSNSTLKNYPFRRQLKDLFRFLPGRVTRMFFTAYDRNTELTEKERLLLARRSKSIGTTVVDDNLLNEHDPGFEFMRYHPDFITLGPPDLRVEVGTTECSRPYSLSVFNFGAIDRCTVNKPDVHAISQAANMCCCAVNSGEKGLTPELVRGGGDIIWQIRYNDLVLRNPDRSFDEALIKKVARKPYIKMIEVQFCTDQDAGQKRTLSEFAVFSLIKKLRLFSDGKPVGIHLLNPAKEMVECMSRSMASSGISPDFINIEESRVNKRLLYKGSGQRFFEAVCAAKSLIVNYGLQTKVIATGVILTEFDILKLCALGADACFSSVGSLMENSILPQKMPFRPQSQSMRLANFQRNTIEATRTLMQRCGYELLSDADLADFFRRVNAFDTVSLNEIFCQTGQERSMLPYVDLN